MAERWCTVTVTDADGRRHSLDVLAVSTYDAAHLYLTHARTQPLAQLPVLTVDTVFEVVTDGRIHRIWEVTWPDWSVLPELEDY